MKQINAALRPDRHDLGTTCILMIVLMLSPSDALAGGPDCDHAPLLAAEGDDRPSPDVLNPMAKAHGLGLLTGWSFATFGGTADAAHPDTAEEPRDWDGVFVTHPLNPKSGALATDVTGTLEIEDRFGQHWLVWQADISDPCGATTDLPLMSANSPALRVDVETYRLAIVDGINFEIPRPPTEENDWIAANWDVAAPILSSIFVTRAGDNCKAGYTMPNGAPVALTFHCKRLSGE